MSTATAPAANLEVEESALGAMMVSQAAIGPVLRDVRLDAEDFYRDRHRLIFGAIRDLHEAGDPVDVLTVTEKLTAAGQLDKAGGKDAVATLAAKVPSPGSATHYAEIVKQNALLRRADATVKRLGATIEEEPGAALNGALDTAQAELAEIRRLALGPITSTTTWSAVDLDPVLAGEESDPPPTMLARSDGPCLIYPKRSHSLFSEPEGGKTTLACLATREVLEAGGRVAYFDFESTPPELLARLLAVGTDPDLIRSGFRYYHPDEPLTDAIWDALAPELEGVDLVPLDGVTEAMVAQGLSPLDNAEVAEWLDLLPRRVQRLGAAPFTLDHVVKDREGRGRYAIGAQHKLAGVDVAYSTKVLKPLGRGLDGLVKIRVEKDRPGHVRPHAPDGDVALMRVSSTEDGAMTITLDPPERDREGAFRPTVLMERVSRAVEQAPGLTMNGIRAAVSGKNDAKQLAIDILISEGFIDRRREGQAFLHYSAKPFREDEEDAPDA